VGTVLLVAADAMEFEGIGRRVGRPVPLQWPIDYSASVLRAGRRWLLVANGSDAFAAQRAAETAQEREAVGCVVSVGFCGGLDPRLAPGDIFVASDVRLTDGTCVARPQTPASEKAFVRGTLISGDFVVATADEKSRLRQAGGDAVEMEAAGVAAFAAGRDLPFFCVRAVTDTAGESFALDLNALRDPTGRIRPSRVVHAALRRPAHGIPELWRLWRRSRLAADRLAGFLADCAFS
jgi:hypothetical protein